MTREAGYEIYTRCDVANFFGFVKYLLLNKEPQAETLRNLLHVEAKDIKIKLKNGHHVWTGHWERLLTAAVLTLFGCNATGEKCKIKKDQFGNKLKESFAILPENLKQHKEVFMPAHCFFNLLGFNRLSPAEIIFLFSSLFIDDSYVIYHYRNIDIRYRFQWLSKKLYLINFLLCVVKEKVENNFEDVESKAQLLQILERSVKNVHMDLNNGNKNEMKDIISLLSVKQFGFKIEEADMISYLEKYFFPDNYTHYNKIWELGSFKRISA